MCRSHLGQGLGVRSKTRHSSHTSVSITFTLTYKDDVRNQTIIGLGGRVGVVVGSALRQASLV